MGQGDGVMKRVALGVAMAFLAVFSIAGIVNARNQLDNERPAIELIESVHDFGRVLEGKTVEHHFHVVNRGIHALEIQRVKPG